MHSNKNGAEMLLWSNRGLNIVCCSMISSAWAGNHPTSAKNERKEEKKKKERELSQMAWRLFAFTTTWVRASSSSGAVYGFLCEIWLLCNLSVIISVQDVRLWPQRNVTEIGVLFLECIRRNSLLISAGLHSHFTDPHWHLQFHMNRIVQ